MFSFRVQYRISFPRSWFAELECIPHFKWIYNTGMLIRWLLALVFAITTVAAPTDAACVLNYKQMPSCCCQAQCEDDSAQCSIGNTCCGSDPVTAVTTQPQNAGYQPSSTNCGILPQTNFLAFDDMVVACTNQPALHLASNKLYLKKRSLLI